MKYFLYLSFFLHFGVSAQAVEKAEVLLSVADFNHKPIANDKILFVGQKSKSTYFVITGANGKAKISLPSGEVYDIKIDALGDALDYNTLEIPSIPAGYSFAEMQLIIEYQMPDLVTLKGLHFETGKAIIQPESIPQLKELANYLLRKKELGIAIGGHTDNVGDANQNLTLSQQRADAVKNYLIGQGIAVSRIRTKGFGSTRPIADNSTANGRAQNRRTEVSVIRK